MEELFLGILSMFLVVVLVPLYFWRRNRHFQSPQEHEDQDKAQGMDTVTRATSSRRMRRRPAVAASSSTTRTTSADVVGGSEVEADGGNFDNKNARKKERRRQEREAQRKAVEDARESRMSKQDRYAEMRRRKDEEWEARERILEEEANAQRAREEEASALEFERWKSEFSIDAEGTTESIEFDGNANSLSNFTEYIKSHKCVPLEDLAAEFKLRTQDCINRITSLENMGHLSGVMDDRGKYIYISLEEMKAVANYIKREGRVGISHLARMSNQFIDLEPKGQIIEELGIKEPMEVP